MNNKKDLFGNSYPICNKCNSSIISVYNSTLTNIKVFGPPFLECDKCGYLNKTFYKPYSKISLFSKIEYWFKVIPFPLLIWFTAGPLFIVGFGSMLLFDELNYSLFYNTIPITTIIGVVFILLKNFKMIKKFEKEHIDVGEEYWET